MLKSKHMRLKLIKGFTLNELLIVIGILAILAGATVLVLNPGELLGQARDSKRIGELNSLASAITFHTNSIVGGYKGEENTVYISLPDTVETCDTLLPSLPAIPAGWSYHCVTAENLQKTDGDGWLPINLNATPGGSPFEQLPIDPENSAANNLYFAYVKSDTGYTLASLLESEKQGREAYDDGGTDIGRFEVGSDFSVWSEASGLVGYWPFNGNGNIINNQTAGFEDNSGNSHNGQAKNTNETGMSFVTGTPDQAVQFDGVDDYVNIGTGNNYFPLTNFSICATVKSSGLAPGMSQNGIISFTYGLSMSINGSGQFWSRMDNGTSLITATVSSSNLYDGSFHHVCLTFDGTNRNMYIDGIIKNTTATTWLGTTRWPTNTCNIGHENNNSAIYKFNGTIDDVQIYNRALTSSEIMAIYNATK